MSTRKRITWLWTVLILAMLLAAMPVWAQDPMPTDKYDLLTLPVEAPSTLPETGLGRAQQADAARWQGLANAYLSSAPAILPTTGLSRAQQADAARWQGWAEYYTREG